MQRRLFRITHNNCWTHWHWWGALIQQQWITLRNYNMRESSESVYLAEQSYHIFDGVWQKLWRLHFFTHTQKKKKKEMWKSFHFLTDFFIIYFSETFGGGGTLRSLWKEHFQPVSLSCLLLLCHSIFFLYILFALFSPPLCTEKIFFAEEFSMSTDLYPEPLLFTQYPLEWDCCCHIAC